MNAAVPIPITMDENWACAEADAVLSQSRLSRRSDSAEALRTPSDDEDLLTAAPVAAAPPSLGVPSPLRVVGRKPELPVTAPWWAYTLREMSKDEAVPEFHRAINVMSACSGISAESFVLEARHEICALSLNP